MNVWTERNRCDFLPVFTCIYWASQMLFDINLKSKASTVSLHNFVPMFNMFCFVRGGSGNVNFCFVCCFIQLYGLWEKIYCCKLGVTSIWLVSIINHLLFLLLSSVTELIVYYCLLLVSAARCNFTNFKVLVIGIDVFCHIFNTNIFYVDHSYLYFVYGVGGILLTNNNNNNN